MSHSVIPPSSAGIWGKPDGCPGWVTMAQCYPETEEKPEAAAGTASHEVGAGLIDEATRGVSDTKFVGRTASNGVVITDEMVEGAELYAGDVIDVMRSTKIFGGPSLGIEQHIRCPNIHKESYGTPDCFLHDGDNLRLHGWDYKFGYEVVEVFENWQGINYMAGLAHLMDTNPDLFPTPFDDYDIHLRIVQPRAFHRDGPIREWVVKGSTLRSKSYFGQLQTAAAEALGGNPTTRSGSHCKHCPGRHACEAALRGGTRLYEAASTPMPVELSPQALGVQLSIVRRAVKQLELLETGYASQVAGLIKKGVNVPGWAPEATFGRQDWDKPFAEVVQMGEMLGHDLRKEALKTPKQAIALGVDGDVIKEYSSTKRTGTKIVPDNGNKAKQVFS